MAAAGTSEHWDAVYARGTSGVSWYQEEPEVSLALIQSLRVARDVPVIDVGGGASHLARELVRRDFGDVTVLDASAVALGAT